MYGTATECTAPAGIYQTNVVAGIGLSGDFRSLWHDTTGRPAGGWAVDPGERNSFHGCMVPAEGRVARDTRETTEAGRTSITSDRWDRQRGAKRRDQPA